MNIFIGIISYLPDNKHIRQARINKCQELLNKLQVLFPTIPVIIVAQNWRGEISTPVNATISEYNKLGILEARQTLRELFINSNYDYIIMFDDDCELQGTKQDADLFLELLKENPGCYVFTRQNMFKLCAISKEVYTQYQLPNLSVEHGTGIEDVAFCQTLKIKCPEKEINYYGLLKEISNWTQGKDISTWDRKNIPTLLKNTQAYLKTLKE